MLRFILNLPYTLPFRADIMISITACPRTCVNKFLVRALKLDNGLGADWTWTIPSDSLLRACSNRIALTPGKFEDAMEYHCRTSVEGGELREQYSPHKLRHAFAIRLYNKTHDIYEVKEALGRAPMQVAEHCR